MLLFGILSDVGFLTQAERTDNGQRHLLHLQLGRHRRELALEGEVHQHRMDKVVLVMAQGYLGAAQLLCNVEELFAALPGTEEAGGLLLARRRSVGSSGTFVGSGGEAGGDDVQGNAKTVAEGLKIGGVRLVVDIFHADVECLDGEVGDVNLGTTGEELQQTSESLPPDKPTRILSSSSMSWYWPSALLKVFQSFSSSVIVGLLRRNRNTQLFHEHQIDGADNEEKCQDVVPMQVCTLEHDVGDDAEHGQRDAFLNDLQLNEVKGTAIFYKAETIGRYLTTVFKKGDAPRESDDTQQGPVTPFSCNFKCPYQASVMKTLLSMSNMIV